MQELLEYTDWVYTCNTQKYSQLKSHQKSIESELGSGDANQQTWWSLSS